MRTVCRQADVSMNVPFRIVDLENLSSATAQGKGSRVVSCLLGDRVWQASRWVPIPIQDVSDCITSFVSAKVGPNDLDE